MVGKERPSAPFSRAYFSISQAICFSVQPGSMRSATCGEGGVAEVDGALQRLDLVGSLNARRSWTIGGAAERASGGRPSGHVVDAPS